MTKMFLSCPAGKTIFPLCSMESVFNYKRNYLYSILKSYMLNLSKISRKFKCILAGHSLTHIVCVCKLYKILRLKLFAIKEELLRFGVRFNNKYQDLFKEMLSEVPKVHCYFNNCQNCPGPKQIFNRLQVLLEANEIS